jgi:hypothetical protein
VYRGTIGSSTNREHIGEAIGGEPPHLKVCQWQPPYSDRLSLSFNYELALMELAASRDLNITVTANFCLVLDGCSHILACMVLGALELDCILGGEYF